MHKGNKEKQWKIQQEGQKSNLSPIFIVLPFYST